MQHFVRFQAPCHAGMRVVQCLGGVIDGITGLVMLPFGRYGTEFYTNACEKIIAWRLTL